MLFFALITTILLGTGEVTQTTQLFKNPEACHLNLLASKVILGFRGDIQYAELECVEEYHI